MHHHDKFIVNDNSKTTGASFSSARCKQRAQLLSIMWWQRNCFVVFALPARMRSISLIMSSRSIIALYSPRGTKLLLLSDMPWLFVWSIRVGYCFLINAESGAHCANVQTIRQWLVANAAFTHIPCEEAACLLACCLLR